MRSMIIGLATVALGGYIYTQRPQATAAQAQVTPAPAPVPAVAARPYSSLLNQPARQVGGVGYNAGVTEVVVDKHEHHHEQHVAREHEHAVRAH